MWAKLVCNFVVVCGLPLWKWGLWYLFSKSQVYILLPGIFSIVGRSGMLWFRYSSSVELLGYYQGPRRRFCEAFWFDWLYLLRWYQNPAGCLRWLPWAGVMCFDHWLVMWRTRIQIVLWVFLPFSSHYWWFHHPSWKVQFRILFSILWQSMWRNIWDFV